MGDVVWVVLAGTDVRVSGRVVERGRMGMDSMTEEEVEGQPDSQATLNINDLPSLPTYLDLPFAKAELINDSFRISHIIITITTIFRSLLCINHQQIELHTHEMVKS
jgi:hypothetical protein